eukprot:7525069-Pyramimonas_sp.AAC.1
MALGSGALVYASFPGLILQGGRDICAARSLGGAGLGLVAFVTDSEEVCRGSWAKLIKIPRGPSADMWKRVGAVMQATERHPGDIAVLNAPSHIDQARSQNIPSHFVAGNVLVDSLSGVAAKLFAAKPSEHTRLL